MPEQSNFKMATIDNLLTPKAVEDANTALADAFRNCHDERTDPKAKRKVIIEFEITPNGIRSQADIPIIIKSKLAPAQYTNANRVYFSQPYPEKGMEARINIEEQMEFKFDDEPEDEDEDLPSGDFNDSFDDVPNNVEPLRVHKKA